jgi:hypothetical protein
MKDFTLIKSDDFEGKDVDIVDIVDDGNGNGDGAGWQRNRSIGSDGRSQSPKR